MPLRRQLIAACSLAWACHALWGQARHSPAERYQMFQEYLVRRADEVTRGNRADIQDLDAWKRKRSEVRKRFLYTLGLDPMPPKTPLHSHVTAELRRAGSRAQT